MPTLSQGQIQAYAQSAGLSPDRARVAAAVAMAESSGNTNAHNPVPPDDSYGLWQINMRPEAGGPERRRKLGITSNTALYDPATNARAMAMISNNGGNFSPWSTYTTPDPKKSYKRYMNGAGDTGSVNPALDMPDLLPDIGSIPGLEPLVGLTAMAELATAAAEWIGNPRNWVRAVQVITGGILVGVGIAVMTRGTWQPAVQAGKKVASVTPIGRGTKAAKAVAKPKPAPKPKTAPKPKVEAS
jgi:hypothetical protein